jgi:hypothetical protein
MESQPSKTDSVRFSQTDKLSTVEPDEFILQRSVRSSGSGLKGLHKDSARMIVFGDDIPDRAMTLNTSFQMLRCWNDSNTFYHHFPNDYT